MTDAPTHQEDYDEFKAEVVADDDTKLNDFSSGSKLDAFAGVSATLAQALRRHTTDTVLSAFISGAEGDDLDDVVADRLGDEAPSRTSGESDSAYLERVDEYIANLGRGTIPAIEYFAGTLDGVLSVASSEDYATGLTTISVTFDSDVTDDETLRDAFFADLGSWRAAGGQVNLETAEG